MNNTINIQLFLDEFVKRFSSCETEVHAKASELANVRVVQGVYAAIGRNDVAALRAALTDDVIFEVIGPPGSPLAGRWQGKDAVLAAAARNFSLFADQEPRPEYVTANGDAVTVLGRETGRYLPNGRTYDVHWLQSFVLRDGQVAYVREVISGPAPWEEGMRDEG